ncbi:leukocyte receptor cluster (LRC) member 1 [Mucor ambiguus]|uniref:Leukocyte receptor cluster (LRC) member 1 n=1 Tax=Mucor ambiguus TaxID=91626 RepID=A0A0C9M1Z7_9FUNG|nr:leukocyte receptor cluster (LRC) member 1 [Mucor ambiguus]
MNILHHKSWHVYNKDNVERVRKDEAEAEAEAKKKQDRVILAESEARLDLLRKRANANLPIVQDKQETKRIEHVNLFQDLEDKHNANSTNPDHEAEQKAKDEKWEKQITMYLDKGTEKAPWYAKPSAQRQDKYIDQHVFKRNHENNDNPHRRKRKPLEINDDPLDYITKTLSKRDEKRRSKREHKPSCSSSDKKKKRHSHSHNHSKSSEKSTTSIEELRAKRLERERSEQSRLKSLYLHDGEDAQEEKLELDDRKRGYNSQFNREETSKAQDHRRKKLRFQQEYN